MSKNDLTEKLKRIPEKTWIIGGVCIFAAALSYGMLSRNRSVREAPIPQTEVAMASPGPSEPMPRVPELATVPNVVGISEQDARSQLQQAHFTASVTTRG